MLKLSWTRVQKGEIDAPHCRYLCGVFFYITTPRKCFATSPIIKDTIDTPAHITSISNACRHQHQPLLCPIHQLHANITTTAIINDIINAVCVFETAKNGSIKNAHVPRYATPVIEPARIACGLSFVFSAR